MEDFLSVIMTRRSVRAYKPDGVPEELLDKVLEAGVYAPTGRNMQSPVIVAVTDKATRDCVSGLNAKVLGSANDPYYGAPVIVLALADPSVNTFIEEPGAFGVQSVDGIGALIHADDFQAVAGHLAEPCQSLEHLGAVTAEPDDERGNQTLSVLVRWRRSLQQFDTVMI